MHRAIKIVTAKGVDKIFQELKSIMPLRIYTVEI